MFYITFTTIPSITHYTVLPLRNASLHVYLASILIVISRKSLMTFDSIGPALVNKNVTRFSQVHPYNVLPFTPVLMRFDANLTLNLFWDSWVPAWITEWFPFLSAALRTEPFTAIHWLNRFLMFQINHKKARNQTEVQKLVIALWRPLARQRMPLHPLCLRWVWKKYTFYKLKTILDWFWATVLSHNGTLWFRTAVRKFRRKVQNGEDAGCWRAQLCLCQ